MPTMTPETLLSLPRRSAPIPSPDGQLILYTETTYSFETHSNKSEIKVFEVSNRQSTLIINGETASDPTWLGTGAQIALLKSMEDGTTHLMIGSVDQGGDGIYSAGAFPGPVANLKIKTFPDGSINFAVSATVTPSGSILNPKREQKTHSSGRVYTSLFVRHWDAYKTPNRGSVWYGTLRERSSRFEINALFNALQGTDLECPVPPFGGKEHFDLGPRGLIVVAKDPTRNPALSTKSDPYLVSLSSFTVSPLSEPRLLETDGLQGATSYVEFSPSGDEVVLLRQDDPLYEAGRNYVVVIHDLQMQTPSSRLYLVTSTEESTTWDRNPYSVTWTADGKSLLLLAEEEGRGNLYVVEEALIQQAIVPRLVSKSGFISQAVPLPGQVSRCALLVSSSTLLSDESWSVRSLHNKGGDELLLGPNMDLYSEPKEDVSELWFNGAEGHKVHAWVLKPSTFRAEGTYPVAFIIHGGPQGAVNDSWTQYFASPAVLAQQGYVVILPNITGSTGYGQDFSDRIQNQWGGHPYDDMVACFEAVRDRLSFADCGRAVCLGTSWGGFMINWIQGHPLGREFQALVCESGVFSTPNRYAADELFDCNRDFGGPIYAHRETYERWNPSRFTEHWKTPQMLVHNELDYRVPITEALAAFNVLQQRGVPSKFLTFPDEGHAVQNPENALLWYKEILDWINHYVGLGAS